MLIDTHCHLTDEKYTNVDIILQNAAHAGIDQLITIATSLSNARLCIQIAEKYPSVFAAVGVYPHEDLDSDATDIERELINALFMHADKIVAIGECGIDFGDHYNPAELRTLDKQVELFELQLNLASKNNLPVVIHNRNGDDYVLSALAKFPNVAGVAHCFSQDVTFAKRCIDAGLYISFSGMLTYPKNTHLIDVAKFVPHDRIVVETDAPYLPPQSKRGSVNEPANISEIAMKLADIWQVPLDEVAAVTSQNAIKLFKLAGH